MQKISKKLLTIICCPICKADLDYNPKENKLKCDKCKKNFGIREGIPLLF